MPLAVRKFSPPLIPRNNNIPLEPVGSRPITYLYSSPHVMPVPSATPVQNHTQTSYHISPKNMEHKIDIDWLFVGDTVRHAPIPNPATPPPLPPPAISHVQFAKGVHAPPPPAQGPPPEHTSLMNPLLMIHGVWNSYDQQML